MKTKDRRTKKEKPTEGRRMKTEDKRKKTEDRRMKREGRTQTKIEEQKKEEK